MALNTKGIDSNEILENLKDVFDVLDINSNSSIIVDELDIMTRNLSEECSIV
ncbi:unnamed protein product [Lupinus luteus]|uniref:EF-hand domain-containing protein n=1 Tax=Lupinus luteus TaxID=3873 RepID=A0AAV1YAP4_LUPLU